MTEASASVSRIRTPFKGLDYFDESDETRFFGRDREIADITARITSERTLVLYGRSGTGKTSLLRAGVIPELRRRGYIPVYVRPLGNPLEDLSADIAKAAQIATPAGTLRELLDEADTNAPVVVILDQFEEMFIRYEEEARQTFVRAMADVIRDKQLDVRWLFSIREEFIAELDAFEIGVGDLLDSRYRLRGLSAFGAREAIAQPLIHANIQFSQKLLRKLVAIAEREHFDPPLIQIICTELFQQSIRAEGDEIELVEADVEQIGDPLRIFRRSLERAQARLSEQALDMCIVLDGLLTSRKTKRPTTLDSLENGDFILDREAANKILFILEDERVVRRERVRGRYWYELVHDRLGEPVAQFCEFYQAFFELHFARDLVRNMAQGAVRSGRVLFFLSADHLEFLNRVQRRIRWTAEERNLIFQSAVQQDFSSVEFWGNSGMAQRSLPQVLERIDDVKNPRATRGALRALRVLTNKPDSALAERCFNIVISEIDESVRREAAQTYLKIATNETITAVEEEFQNASPDQRVKTAEYLARVRDILGKTHIPKSARHVLPADEVLGILEKIKSTLNTKIIWAIAAWSLLVGAPLAQITVTVQRQTLVWLILIGMFISFAVLIAPVIVYACRPVAMEMVRASYSLDGNTSWSSLFTKSRREMVVAILPLLALLLLVLPVLALDHPVDRSFLPSSLGAMALLLLTILVILKGSEYAIANTNRKFTVAAWATICSAGLPLIPYFLVMQLTEIYSLDAWHEVAFFTSAVISSSLGFTLIFVLGRLQLRQFADRPPVRPIWKRIAQLGMLALLVVMLIEASGYEARGYSPYFPASKINAAAVQSNASANQMDLELPSNAVPKPWVLLENPTAEVIVLKKLDGRAIELEDATVDQGYLAVFPGVSSIRLGRASEDANLMWQRLPSPIALPSDALQNVLIGNQPELRLFGLTRRGAKYSEHFRFVCNDCKDATSSFALVGVSLRNPNGEPSAKSFAIIPPSPGASSTTLNLALDTSASVTKLQFRTLYYSDKEHLAELDITLPSQSESEPYTEAEVLVLFFPPNAQ